MTRRNIDLCAEANSWFEQARNGNRPYGFARCGHGLTLLTTVVAEGNVEAPVPGIGGDGILRFKLANKTSRPIPSASIVARAEQRLLEWKSSRGAQVERDVGVYPAQALDKCCPEAEGSEPFCVKANGMETVNTSVHVAGARLDKRPAYSKIYCASPTTPGKDTMNPLADEHLKKFARVTSWRSLREEEYTISVTTLHPGVRADVLERLSRFGIARLRWQGDVPTVERLQSLEQWIGPARSVQNDYVGKVKALVPNYNAPPNTGDSSQELTPHVDGTQDEMTPGVLAFQYDYSATWGAESTFVDMAAALAEFPGDKLEEVLTALARGDCATCTKTKNTWTKTFNGPIVRALPGGAAFSVRLREDDLLRVTPACQSQFELLKAELVKWAASNVTRYTPQEGDVVIFDNWRVLHGRKAIGGRHQRIHHRMWIDRLLPEHEGKYLLGIRPVSPGLMAAIEEANRIGSGSSPLRTG